MGAEHKKLVRNKKTYGLSCVILGLDPRTQVNVWCEALFPLSLRGSETTVAIQLIWLCYNNAFTGLLRYRSQ